VGIEFHFLFEAALPQVSCPSYQAKPMKLFSKAISNLERTQCDDD
jgi:hypothetical protein